MGDPGCWTAMNKTTRLATLTTPTQTHRTILRVGLTALFSSHVDYHQLAVTESLPGWSGPFIEGVDSPVEVVFGEAAHVGGCG